MPKVTLIDYTGYGHPDPLFAAKKLVFTKMTRLKMSPDSFDKAMGMSDSEVMKELEYMAGTIPSSWEFADVTFIIEQASRALAQQITRTRFTPMDSDLFGSYAMQSQRIQDMSGMSFDAVDPFVSGLMNENIKNYQMALSEGYTPEEARDLLPMGLHCNLVVKYNFRMLVETVLSRQSIRVQGPYVLVVDQMKDEVLSVWDWAESFFRPREERALEMLREVALELKESGAVYKGPAGQIAKAIDLIKKGG